MAALTFRDLLIEIYVRIFLIIRDFFHFFFLQLFLLDYQLYLWFIWHSSEILVK